MKLWYIIQILQIVALATIKVTALAFYRRIFVTRTHNTILDIIIWSLLIIVIAWGLGLIGFYIAACGTHVDAAWSGFTGFKTFCLRTERFEKAYAISDFLLDTFVLIVPLPSVQAARISIKRIYY